MYNVHVVTTACICTMAAEYTLYMYMYIYMYYGEQNIVRGAGQPAGSALLHVHPHPGSHYWVVRAVIGQRLPPQFPTKLLVCKECKSTYFMEHTAHTHVCTCTCGQTCII